MFSAVAPGRSLTQQTSLSSLLSLGRYNNRIWLVRTESGQTHIIWYWKLRSYLDCFYLQIILEKRQKHIPNSSSNRLKVMQKNIINFIKNGGNIKGTILCMNFVNGWVHLKRADGEKPSFLSLYEVMPEPHNIKVSTICRCKITFWRGHKFKHSTSA